MKRGRAWKRIILQKYDRTGSKTQPHTVNTESFFATQFFSAVDERRFPIFKTKLSAASRTHPLNCRKNIAQDEFCQVWMVWINGESGKVCTACTGAISILTDTYDFTIC